MINESEIVFSLLSSNEINFYIPDVWEYAKKVITLGKSIEIRHEVTNKLISVSLMNLLSSELLFYLGEEQHQR